MLALLYGSYRRVTPTWIPYVQIVTLISDGTDRTVRLSDNSTASIIYERPLRIKQARGILAMVDRKWVLGPIARIADVPPPPWYTGDLEMNIAVIPRKHSRGPRHDCFDSEDGLRTEWVPIPVGPWSVTFPEREWIVGAEWEALKLQISDAPTSQLLSTKVYEAAGLKAGRYCNSPFESDQQGDVEDQQTALEAYQIMQTWGAITQRVSPMDLISHIQGSVDLAAPRNHSMWKGRARLYLKDNLEAALGVEIESMATGGNRARTCEICEHAGYTVVSGHRIKRGSWPQYRYGFTIEMPLDRWEAITKSDGEKEWCLCLWCVRLLAELDGLGLGKIGGRP